MLVISRKVGQRVMIGEKITVTVLETAGGRVKLGVSAPLEVPVHREELARQIEARPHVLDFAEYA